MGSRKNAITKECYELSNRPTTVKELIQGMVEVCVDNYNERAKSSELLTNLSIQNLQEQAVSGKIGFGVNYGTKRAEMTAAVANALLSFEDGIYRIFIGEQELINLADPVELQENAELTFVRMTMLSGRMW